MKLTNQQLIKNTNMKQLYSSIYAHPGISRANLAKANQLSKTTVSTLVDELIAREFVLDGGTGESSAIGRKPNCLYVRTDSYFVVVLNWVGNMVYAYLIDVTGDIRYQETRELAPEETYVTCSIPCVYDSVLRHCDPGRVLGICVVVSAMIDAAHNEVYSTTLSLPAMGSESLIDALKETFPEYPVAFLEDTACYAYAEKIYGEVTTEKNFAFLNFGRGIGATLFIEGNMMGKASGSFTQFGHYSVDPEGPLCVCGNHGCLEAMISEHRLKERISEFGVIASLEGKETVTFQELGQAAAQDPPAHKLVCQMAWELSQALGNLICVVNPSLIILGGKIPALGDLFLDEVRSDLKRVGFRKMVDSVTVRYSSLPSDCFLNGAMKYFFDIHYRFTGDAVSRFFVG